MSTLLEQFSHAQREFGSRVAQVRDDQWGSPTPCDDWDVRMLVAHVVNEQRWAPYLLSGGSVEQAGDRFSGDPLGSAPRDAWESASAESWQAFSADGGLDHQVAVTKGTISARDYIWEMTVDATVHAWDLARAIGADEHLDAELVRRIHAEAEKDVASLASRGRFGPPLSVASSADLQSRMLALFGRRA